jgi:predicted DNA-binding transcriptional regulator YafY
LVHQPADDADAQKAERLNAAHRLLVRGNDLADAATELSRAYRLSRRQAYRYLEEAAAIGHPVPVTEPSIPITLKIPGGVVRDLRSYSADSGLTLGEIVARAISSFLKAARRHG